LILRHGSIDGSAEVAKQFAGKVNYYFQSQKGPGVARNYGIDLAQGNFLAFLDADDIWIENKLSLQMQIFQTEKDIDMVFGYLQNFHSSELEETSKNKLYCPPELMAGYHPGTMLIKREAFSRVGQFEAHWKMGEFISWYARATDLEMKVKMLPDLVMLRRIHQTNLGIRQRQERTDYVQIVKAALDRRRAKNN
jgi:glycosyltransferase involved in cell wall biosynthesis